LQKSRVFFFFQKNNNAYAAPVSASKQVQIDAKNKKSIFGNYGYPILIKANKQYKKHENNSEIWNSMWDFLF